MLNQAPGRSRVRTGAAPAAIPDDVSMDGIALHDRAVVIVDSIAESHCLANWTASRSYSLSGISVLSVWNCVSIRVSEWLLRGHKVHSQDQKEKNRCNLNFSLGKRHFCNLVLDWVCAASVKQRYEQRKPGLIGILSTEDPAFMSDHSLFRAARRSGKPAKCAGA